VQGAMTTPRTHAHLPHTAWPREGMIPPHPTPPPPKLRPQFTAAFYALAREHTDRCGEILRRCRWQMADCRPADSRGSGGASARRR
jgi:hypothetical protein